MNVLAIAPHFPPLRIGGVETYTKGVVEELHARGHRVSVAVVEDVTRSTADDCTAVCDATAGYVVHRLTLGVDGRRSFALMTGHAGAEAWFTRYLRADAPDVVHVHSGYLLGHPAMAAARHQAIPYVVTLHDYWFACPRITRLTSRGTLCSGPEGAGKCTACLLGERRRFRWADRALGGALTPGVRWAVDRALPIANRTSSEVARRQDRLVRDLKGAACVIAPTRFVAESVGSIGFAPEQVRVSPHGLARLPVLPRVAGDGFRIRYIGQIAPHKGVELAVEAVRANRDPSLRLAIHGPLTPYPAYVAQLRAQAGNDGRITFDGPYDRDGLPAILAATEVVVVPSVCHEVAGIVIMEAHAAGVPVVASRLGGIPEVIRDGVDGLLFDPFSPGDLQRQLGRVMSEPGLLDRLRAGARPPRSLADDVDGLVGLFQAAAGRA